MPKPNTLEICRKYLFEPPEEKLSPQLQQRLIRIRGAFIHWTEFPMKGEIEIRAFLTENYDVQKSQAYDDIEIIKALIGNVKSASKDWHRYRFNYMVEEAYELAKEKQDAKAMAMIIREHGKNNQLHIPDHEQIPWDEIVPQLIEPTEDPTVIGLKRMPNARKRAKELLKKYSADLTSNIEAQDIEHEEVEDED